MEKSLRYFVLLPLLLLSIACQAHDNPTTRQIATNGVGEVKAAPDQAVISVTAKATQRTSKGASERVNEKVNSYLAALKKQGIKQKDIIAASIQLNPRYEHRPNIGRHFSGYEASRSIQVTLYDLKDISTLLDLAIDADISIFNGIRYQSSQEDELMVKARQMAIEDSKQKAELLANAYDAELGPVININYHSNRPAIQASRQDMPEMAFAAKSASTAVYLPDELTFRDQIQVSFDLIIPQ